MNYSWRIIFLTMLLLVVAGGLALQRQANAELRAEIALVRAQNQKVERLKAEITRLSAAPTAAAELERLRAEHTATTRLRDEVDGLRQRVRAMDEPQRQAR